MFDFLSADPNNMKAAYQDRIDRLGAGQNAAIDKLAQANMAQASQAHGALGNLGAVRSAQDATAMGAQNIYANTEAQRAAYLNAMAQQQSADVANRNQWIDRGLQIGGAVAGGIAGGPMGAAAGSQAGSAIGNMATGGQGATAMQGQAPQAPSPGGSLAGRTAAWNDYIAAQSARYGR